MMGKSYLCLVLFIAFFASASQAKVYKNVNVGRYDSSIKLADYKGMPFTKFMIDVVYGEMSDQSKNRSNSRDFIAAIKKGEGVEIRLTNDVSTFHVKYKGDWETDVERSGRSFSAVGSGRRIRYVADASYKHYLRSLEPLVNANDQEVKKFYSAILKVLVNSDPSGFDKLTTKSKQVAADFVAIYVAEQYRRLTATKGKRLGSRHRWDDAVLQVTLLASFHGGQSQQNKRMFYEGEFTNKVYPQDACLYKTSKSDQKRKSVKKRSIRLYDYWQFTVRSECPGRSGVNLTRRDFEKLGRAVTRQQIQLDGTVFLQLFRRNPKNFYKETSESLMQKSLQSSVSSDRLVSQFVESIMAIHKNAESITRKIK